MGATTARPMMIDVVASMRVLASLDDQTRPQHGWTCPEPHDEVVKLRALR